MRYIIPKNSFLRAILTLELYIISGECHKEKRTRNSKAHQRFQDEVALLVNALFPDVTLRIFCSPSVLVHRNVTTEPTDKNLTP